LVDWLNCLPLEKQTNKTMKQKDLKNYVKRMRVELYEMERHLSMYFTDELKKNKSSKGIKKGDIVYYWENCFTESLCVGYYDKKTKDGHLVFLSELGLINNDSYNTSFASKKRPIKKTRYA